MITITVNGVDYDVPSSAADTNWAAQQVAFEQALAAAVTLLLATTWSTQALAGNWSGTLQKTKSASGWVSLMTDGVDSGVAPLLATLPVGYRPTTDLGFVVPCGAPTFDKLALCSIDTGGAINLTPMGGASTSDVYGGTRIVLTFSTDSTP